MFSRNWGIRLFCSFVSLAAATPAAAWYGPFCYSSKARQVSLTVPTMTGEAPGDVKVTFDDNDGKARLVSARASTKVKNAHEIVLARDEDSRSGVFAVIVTSGRSSFGYKFELEFRDTPEECTGTIIKVSDKFAGDIGGSETVAAKPAPKPLKRKHVAPPEPADDGDESASAAKPVVARGEDSGAESAIEAGSPAANAVSASSEKPAAGKSDPPVGGASSAAAVKDDAATVAEHSSTPTQNESAVSDSSNSSDTPKAEPAKKITADSAKSDETAAVPRKKDAPAAKSDDSGKADDSAKNSAKPAADSDASATSAPVANIVGPTDQAAGKNPDSGAVEEPAGE